MQWYLYRNLWALIIAALVFAFYSSLTEAKTHEYFKIYDDIFIELKVCGKSKYIFSSDARTIWWNKSKNWQEKEIDAAKFGSMVFVIEDDEGCEDEQTANH